MEKEQFDLAARTLMKLGLTHQNAFDFKLARDAFDHGFELWRREPEMRPTEPLQDAPHALRLYEHVPTTLDPARADDLPPAGAEHA